MNKSFMKNINGNFSKKAAVFLLIVFALSVCLGGCSLARADLQKQENGDELIGVFVAFEKDLGDYIIQEGDTLYYDEQKLVKADGTEIYLTDEQLRGFDVSFTLEGEKQKDETYRFGDIEGFYMGQETAASEDEKEDSHLVTTMCASEGIYDVQSHVESKSLNDKASEEIVSMEGTIGVSSSFEGVFRVNRVYKRSDGSVYTVIPGSAGVMISSEPDAASGKVGSTVSESFESSIKGMENEQKVVKQTRSFHIDVEKRDFFEGAELRQMSSEHEVIKNVQISSQELPQMREKLKVEDNTAYVIIEENFVGRDGIHYKKRTAYDCENIGEDAEANDGTAEHTFYRTKENGKVELISLEFVR